MSQDPRPRATGDRSAPIARPASAPPRNTANSHAQAARARSAVTSVQVESLPEDQQVKLSDDVGAATTQGKFGGWMLSLIIHVMICVILMFIVLPGRAPKLDIVGTFSTEIGDQLDLLTDDQGSLNPNEALDYALTMPEEVKIEDFLVFEKTELPFEQDAIGATFEQSRIEMTEILSGRTDPGTKNDLLSKYGGNRLTQEAVALGLEWLKHQQSLDGSWSLQGPYADGRPQNRLDNRPAATALALLAFQGDGNTRTHGSYANVVKKGWTWLLKQQNPDGSFAPAQRSSNDLFYTQALCTIALCEILALEKKSNPSLRKQAREAVAFLLENQHAKFGGWRYQPQVGSDLSVTSWCLMALKTAEMAEISVPQSAYDRISSFLDSVSYDDQAAYVYMLDAKGDIPEHEKRPSMTAAGLVCREYLGWPQNHPALVRGAESLASPENLVQFPKSEKEEKDFSINVYSWYISSLALKALGPYNKYWRRWNSVMSRELPAQQVPKGENDAGSWSPQYDEYGFDGGRLYVTTLSILCLEVYYRHLSIYR
ncbi:MAG: terpene cyclase/mutase family protein [Planctomycetia bacterium]|nr:terpene cyclase/mutase family protein [Planctomycetia bacterium]